MGNAYLAHDTNKNIFVVLRLIPHEGHSEIIELERKAAHLQMHIANLDPHIVKVYQYGELEGFFFSAIEYVEGEDLYDLIAKGPIHPDRAIEIAYEICSVLGKIHSSRPIIGGQSLKGVVHGDITPTNIRLDSKGRVRVFDLGIAHFISQSFRQADSAYGNLMYASPEQLGTGLIDARSDIWSVGVLLYEMITGINPFQSETSRDVHQRILSRKLLQIKRETCPAELQQIILKALATDVRKRYQNADDMRRDLIRFNPEIILSILKREGIGSNLPAQSNDNLDNEVKPLLAKQEIPKERRDVDEIRLDHAPRIFISYSWDNAEHKNWVRYLAESLVRHGVDVRLDQWDVKAGDSFTRFMEELVDADFILALCTPDYARKSNHRDGGVGYEQQIVSGEMMSGIDRSKFIPLICSGDYSGPNCSIPTHFKGTLAIDFRRDEDFKQSFEELLHVIFLGQSKFIRPPMGKAPSLRAIHKTKRPNRKSQASLDTDDSRTDQTKI